MVDKLQQERHTIKNLRKFQPREAGVYGRVGLEMPQMLRTQKQVLGFRQALFTILTYNTIKQTRIGSSSAW